MHSLRSLIEKELQVVKARHGLVQQTLTLCICIGAGVDVGVEGFANLLDLGLETSTLEKNNENILLDLFACVGVFDLLQ